MNFIADTQIELIKRDCLYAGFLHGNNDEHLSSALKRAGFIEEPRTETDERAIYDTRFLTMPIRHVGGETDLPQAIIISTGSYSPVHAGHVEIMNKAKQYVESLGYQVIQGVMSASHDSYVSIKNGGIAKLHIGARVQKIYEIIQGSNWLTYDRFEGEGVSCALNFSTVIERIRNLVLAHNPKANAELKVFYVFGSDNVGFADAFVGNDIYHGVCVDRGGYDISEQKARLRTVETVHFVEAQDETAWISSTKVREAEARKGLTGVDHNDLYLIRTDCVPKAFADGLQAVIRENVVDGLTIRQFSSSDVSLSKSGTISLDKFVKGEYSLDVSRVFEISGGQISANGMTSLVQDIFSQTTKVPEGAYCLVDDDSVSGYTLRVITEMLSAAGIMISGYDTLIRQVVQEGERLYDVIDARDFLIGSEKCGLVVDLFGEAVRVPYVFPFVNLASRARVLADRQLICSKAIWELNKQYAGSVSIASLDSSQRRLYEYFGYGDHYGSVGDVCDYFIELIDNYLSSEK